MQASESTLNRADPAYAGQAVYTPAMLRVYDTIAYRVNGPLLWRCPVGRFVELYDANASGRHLDIGVGTGYLLDRCRFPVADPEITLMDLNPEPLAFAARRLRRYEPRIHRADVLEKWELPAGSFDSIAMFNVLHCVPGTMSEKAIAFEQAREALAPGGKLFGATVLSRGVEQTRRSRAALKRFNEKGIFNNLDDDLNDLDGSLAHTFGFREIEVRGSMALFTAWMES
jgi:SAM-dependent methyltransferase